MIRSKNDYDVGLAYLVRLMEQDPPRDSADSKTLIMLADQIAAYEIRHYPMSDKSRIGVRLKRVRISRGLRHRDLCKGLGIGRNTISQIESGKHSPGLKMLVQICRFLDVSVDSIVKDIDFKNSQ